MNLTGHWEGKYTYGEGYSAAFTGKSEPFEFDIVDRNGIISGTCIDNLVKLKKGNESYIIGAFKQNEIVFKKRYKFHFGMDDSGSLMLDDKVKFVELITRADSIEDYFHGNPIFQVNGV